MFHFTTIFALYATLAGLSCASPIPQPAPQGEAPWQTASWQIAPWQTASWQSAPWQTAPGQTVPGPVVAASAATSATESSVAASATITPAITPSSPPFVNDYHPALAFVTMTTTMTHGNPADPPPPSPTSTISSSTDTPSPAYTAPASSSSVPASSSAPAPQQSSGTSSAPSGEHSGIATINPNPTNALGSCGGSTGDATFTVALSTAWITSFDSALCNKYITLTNTGPSTDMSIGGKGNSVKVQVMDTCEGCDAGHLDLSEAAWNKLTNNAAWSQVSIEWSFDS